MFNLESLANLGEVIGAIAVVVSLIYLAVQVRQNTEAQRAENFSRALDRVAAMQSSLSHSAETAVLLSKGLEDPAKLTPRERLQFTWVLYELFGAFEFMFLTSKSDAIPEEVWNRWSSAMAWWLAFPGARTWWKARPIPFAESFTVLVEELIASTPADSDVTRRYREFVASGKSVG